MKAKGDVSKSKSSSSVGTAWASFHSKLKIHMDGVGTFYGVNPANNPFLQSHPIHKMMDGSIPEVEKKKDYGGCDWLHEISVTIRQNKSSSIPCEE